MVAQQGTLYILLINAYICSGILAGLKQLPVPAPSSSGSDRKTILDFKFLLEGAKLENSLQEVIHVCQL